MFPVVSELAADGVPVAVACRVLGVSTSGFYAWRDRPPPPRAVADQQLTDSIGEIHPTSHGTYGVRRVHAELRLGQDVRVGRKRVERLMRAGRKGCTAAGDPAAVPSDDLVARRFTVAEPNRLWCADITQHPTGEGWLYLAVVLGAFSRRMVGWAMADHPRTELVVDALQRALWQRRPPQGTVHHADHGSQYTSWAFGQRLGDAGLLGSMGTVGDALGNSVAESFSATLQTELLDRRTWASRADLESAVFLHRGLYNPRRRHSTFGYLSPADYETRATVGAA